MLHQQSLSSVVPKLSQCVSKLFQVVLKYCPCSFQVVPTCDLQVVPSGAQVLSLEFPSGAKWSPFMLPCGQRRSGSLKDLLVELKMAIWFPQGRNRLPIGTKYSLCGPKDVPKFPKFSQSNPKFRLIRLRVV